ncbi:MAG: amidase [Dehalococcoidia bacterium]
MNLPIPSNKDINRIAKENFFELTKDELSAFEKLVPEYFDQYEKLKNLNESSKKIQSQKRMVGQIPTKKEDPTNSIYRKFSIKEKSSGKLHGKRFGLKSCISIKDMEMNSGSSVFEGYIAKKDATIVTRLLDSGAELVASLNMDHLGCSGGGNTCSYGVTLNPHNHNHLSGGSSSGSGAALSYKDIDITIGGDQGGSIRIPASWCGVVGLKPTYGLIPYTGIVGHDHSFDATGPMANNVDDIAITLEVIAGHDGKDPRQKIPNNLNHNYTKNINNSIKGLSIGILSQGFDGENSDPAVDKIVLESIEKGSELGLKTRSINLPEHLNANIIFWGLCVEGLSKTLTSNLSGYHWEGEYDLDLMEFYNSARKNKSNSFSPQVKLLIIIGSYIKEKSNGLLYGKAQNLRMDFKKTYNNIFEEIDILAMPTTPITAHPNNSNSNIVNYIKDGWSMMQNTVPFNLTGHPAISIPCGKINGLPVGLMLASKHFNETQLLQVAKGYETILNWKTNNK